MRPRIPFAGLELFASGGMNSRRSDPPTSQAAAESLDPRDHIVRLGDVYRAANERGLTDEEAAAAAGLAQGWKRCSDLRRLGFIVATGATRAGKSGRAQMICRWQGDGT